MNLLRLIALSSLLFSFHSMATMTVEEVNCPQQFVASVEDVVDDAAFDYSYNKVQVILKKLEVIKGVVPQNIIINVLKHGPFEFIKGQIYKIQLQDGNLCWAEKKHN